LRRIKIGLEVVNAWIKISKENNIRNKDISSTEELFKDVTNNTLYIMSNIEELFANAACAYEVDVSPLKIEMDTEMKINHWLIYREYQTLLEYSNQLLSIIHDKYKE
jgi:hypothetical protein